VPLTDNVQTSKKGKLTCPSLFAPWNRSPQRGKAAKLQKSNIKMKDDESKFKKNIYHRGHRGIIVLKKKNH